VAAPVADSLRAVTRPSHSNRHLHAWVALALALQLLVGGGLVHTGDHELRSTVETAFGLPELHGVDEALGFANLPASNPGDSPFCPECLSRLQQTGSEALPAGLAIASVSAERCPVPAAERTVTLPRRAPSSRGPPLSA